jgi:hypothetical protein
MIDANGIYQDIFDYDFTKSSTMTILSPDEVSTELNAHMQLPTTVQSYVLDNREHASPQLVLRIYTPITASHGCI